MKRLLRLRVMLTGLVALLSFPVLAQEAWLVTYGPGAEVWERFGHNALWLRDEERGLDHTFSFGYFELDRPGFHYDFARGIMRYFGSASTPEREFAFYRSRDRSITVQQLNLDAEQIRQLHALLYEAIYPIPQYYDYDYLFNNCSTWLRNLIDKVVDGRLRRQLQEQPARLDFRDHVRRLNESRAELHAGLSLLLGPVIDQPRTAWEEGFVPAALAHWIGQARIDGEPLVTETRILYESRIHHVPERPRGLWWFYCVLGLVCAGLILLPLGLGASFWTLLPWRAGVAGSFAAGTLILLMWHATAHYPVAGNLMLFLLHPLWLVFLLPLSRTIQVAVWWVLTAAAAAGVLLLAFPAGPQYRGEVLLWLAPTIAALLALARVRMDKRLGRASRAGEPGHPVVQNEVVAQSVSLP